MVKSRVLWIVGWLAALVTSVNASPPRFPATRSVARDGSGTVWSVSGDDQHVLQRWNGKGWTKTEFLPRADGRVVSLLPRADGRVVAIWNGGSDDYSGTRDYFVSLHQGLTSRLGGKFQLRPPATTIKSGGNSSSFLALESFPGAPGSSFLVFEGRQFYRLGDSGQVGKMFELPAKSLTVAKPGTTTAPRPQLPVGSLVDGRGRVWFWHDIWRLGAGVAHLHGFVLNDGSAFSLRSTWPGLPPGQLPPVHALVNDGPDRLFLALRKSGVFEVDTKTLRAKPVVPPTRGAFGWVRQLWAQNGELFVVAGLPTSNPNSDDTFRTNNLWRRRDGKWKLLLSGLDKVSDDDEAQSRRPFLKTAEGLWVGAYGDGLWFFGSDDKPQLVDWKRGLNLPLRHELFPLGGANVLVSSGDGTTMLPGFAGLAHERPAPGVSTMRFRLDPVQDADLHLWAMPTTSARALDEWNGTQWKRHLMPRSLDANSGAELSLDARGRVWIPSGSLDRQSAIFDKGTNKWAIYPTYETALLANRGSLPVAHRNLARTGRGPYTLPRQSRDGRICFRNADEKIVYFDGQKWHKWKRGDIERGSEYSELDNPPFFGSRDQLCVQFSELVFELSSKGWQQTKRETDPDFKARTSDPTDQSANADAPASPGGEGDEWSNSIRDGEGTLWLLWKGALYRSPEAPTPRKTQLLLGENQNQPFLDGRFFNEALIDPRGNAWLYTGYGFTEWVKVDLEAPLPQTTLHLEVQPSGSITADFAAPGVGANPQFSWRLDGKTWSAPTTRRKLRLDFLSPGRHELEVRAFGATGRPDPTPARAMWNAQADTPQQLQGFIFQLRAPGFEQREQAVRALARDKEHSLPLLRASLDAARARKDDDAVWWLSAAVQAAGGTP